MTYVVYVNITHRLEVEAETKMEAIEKVKELDWEQDGTIDVNFDAIKKESTR